MFIENTIVEPTDLYMTDLYSGTDLSRMDWHARLSCFLCMLEPCLLRRDCRTD